MIPINNDIFLHNFVDIMVICIMTTTFIDNFINCMYLFLDDLRNFSDVHFAEYKSMQLCTVNACD